MRLTSEFLKSTGQFELKGRDDDAMEGCGISEMALARSGVDEFNSLVRLCFDLNPRDL